METLVKTNEYVETAIAKLDFTDQKLDALCKECADLNIEGIDDKEGYEKVRVQIGKLRTTRTTIEEKRKEIKAPILEAGRKVDEYAKDIIDQLSGIEKPLKSKKDSIDFEKEQIKLKKEREEQQRINARVSQLIENGMSFNGYVYSISDPGSPHMLQIDSLHIKQLPDDEFSAFLDKVKIEHQKELDRKAKEERLKKEKEEQLRREMEELEAKRIAFEQEQERARQEQERIRLEQEAAAKKIKEEQEQIERERLEAAAAKEREEQEKLRQAEIEKAKKEAAKRAIEQTKEKERKAAERAARMEALKPDKEKLNDLADRIAETPVPDVKDEKAKEIVRKIQDGLINVSETLRRLAENLD